MRDVYVPMSGGIQEVLVRKIINEENTSDGLAARFLFNHLVIAKIPASIERQQEIDRILFEDHRGFDTMKGIFDRLVAIRDVEQQVLMDLHARDHLALFAQYLENPGTEGIGARICGIHETADLSVPVDLAGALHDTREC